MGEIKSAWEIAREKAAKLGELSPEERKQQREGRCSSIGKALAEQYLSQHDIQHLEAEFSKYNGEERELITQAVLQRLTEALDLRYSLTLDTISQGALILIKTETVAETIAKIRELFQEYRETEEREKQEIERTGMEILHQLRISGTAISQINIRAKEEWQKKLGGLAQPFDERLGKLKQELLTSVRPCASS